jgi:hypothetical protein
LKPLWVRVVVVVVIVAFVGVGAEAIIQGFRGSPSSSAATPDPTPTDSGYLAPVQDGGTPAAVAGVKKVLPGLLTDSVAVQRLPKNLAARAAQIANPKAVAARRQAINRVWVPSQRAGVVAGLEQALAELGADASYTPFQDNRFVLKRWQGVEVHGHAATALLVGHETYKLTGTWQADADQQYQIALGSLDPKHHWGLLGVSRVPLPTG